MDDMHKLVVGSGLQKTSEGLPPHLSPLVKAARMALAHAMTPAERQAAERQASDVCRQLESHVGALLAQAEFKKAHLKPLRFLER
jgi:hypothetical protein